jgi:hypothetical protein
MFVRNPRSNDVFFTDVDLFSTPFVAADPIPPDCCDKRPRFRKTLIRGLSAKEKLRMRSMVSGLPVNRQSPQRRELRQCQVLAYNAKWLR